MSGLMAIHRTSTIKERERERKKEKEGKTKKDKEKHVQTVRQGLFVKGHKEH